MNSINWSNYKFHCSSLPTLMTKSRSKTEILSETAKTYLKEIYIKEVFGREKFDTKSKFTDKGIACESDSLDLVQKVLGETHFKNKKQLENEYITGTPDIITETVVKDIKTSWDIWTFGNVDEEQARKDYYYQLLGYMWLTNTKTSDLIYCLVNTPEQIISAELYKLSFRYPDIGTSDEADAKYKKNYIFDDIEPSLRVKQFNFPFLEDEINEIIVIISEAREFLQGYKL